MNETKWLQGADGEPMLDFVAGQLTPRQWVLLSAAYLRRLWDLFPPGALRDAIEFAECTPQPMTPAQRTEQIKTIEAAVEDALAKAAAIQLEIVRLCDPDAADLANPVLARPNQSAPAFPLFKAASNYARNSIGLINDALGQAVHALRGLFAEPGEEMFGQVRGRVEHASDTWRTANQAAANALRMKQEGDDTADRAAAVKNKGLEEAKAIEFVRRIEEGPKREGDAFEAEMKRERAASKTLGKLLREVVGNPFGPPAFDPAWRTSSVVKIAESIYAERAFDRLPVLADALLDADCDAEAILRHCRGTELGHKDPPQHVRGCWVVELVLDRWSPVSATAKPPARKRKPRVDFDDLDIGLPLDIGDDELA